MNHTCLYLGSHDWEYLGYHEHWCIRCGKTEVDPATLVLVRYTPKPEYSMNWLGWLFLIALCGALIVGTAKGQDILPQCQSALTACNDLVTVQDEQVTFLKEQVKFFRDQAASQAQKGSIMAYTALGASGGAVAGGISGTGQGALGGALAGAITGLGLWLAVEALR